MYNIFGNQECIIEIELENFVDLWTADEIILLDVSKKNKLSKKFLEIVKYFSLNCFVPISAGGGIKSIEDVNLEEFLMEENNDP